MDVSLNTQSLYSAIPDVRNEMAHEKHEVEAPATASSAANKADDAAAEKENGMGVEAEQGRFPHEDIDDRNVDSLLEKSIKEVNKKLALVSREMSYSYHEQTKVVSVKVYNSETKELIREIPPQKSLDALAKMWELAGIMVDEKK